MAKIDTLVEDFLAQKKIAVVGVSDQRETGCNLAYRKFKEAGYEVSAVNPRIEALKATRATRTWDRSPRSRRQCLFSPIPRSPIRSWRSAWTLGSSTCGCTA